MSNPLALAKIGVQFTMSSKTKHTIIITKTHGLDWKKLLQNKEIIFIDGKTLNLSFCESIIEFDLKDKKYDSVSSWINDLDYPLQQVAIAREESYKNNKGTNISLHEMISWIDSFQKEGKSFDYVSTNYYKLYIKAGGNPDLIGPFEEKKKK